MDKTTLPAVMKMEDLINGEYTIPEKLDRFFKALVGGKDIRRRDGVNCHRLSNSLWLLMLFIVAVCDKILEINAILKNPSSLSPLASGWILNDDKYDFVWFAGEQFPSSAADIVIKKPILLENQNTKQDDDYDDIDNNGSSDNDDDYEDASVFCDTFTE
ncbi:hypothetical protein TNCV_4356941 [Trichonephila clavipes]|nr:hypothetical protein TNCV_4356941 [Trichonephila clavipes]